MTRWFLRLVLAAQIARHVAVLAAMSREVRALKRELAPTPAAGDVRTAVVLPVLSEQSSLAEAVEHFRGMLRPADRLLIVTTARERPLPDQPSTPAMAAAMTGEQVSHLHHGGAGRKADQVNLAAAVLASQISGESEWLVVVYDVDSRPDPTSLEAFAAAAAAYPDVGVFHQSASFEARGGGGAGERMLAAAGALRANRFVLAYELPRLRRRRPQASRFSRAVAAVTYAHVTGHGLAIRLTFLRARPMPAQTPMEDMHYSFGLSVDAQPVVCLDRLDRSAVPQPAREQYRQAERWFTGPGRAVSYLRGHPQRSWRAYAVAVSAALISLEWLSCAVAPAALLAAARQRRLDRLLACGFSALYAAELTLTAASPLQRPCQRLAGLAGFGAVNTAFGLAGWTSVAKQLIGRPLRAKTARG